MFVKTNHKPQSSSGLIMVERISARGYPNGEMLGREVQYGSAVQLDGLLGGVAHNALFMD